MRVGGSRFALSRWGEKEGCGNKTLLGNMSARGREREREREGERESVCVCLYKQAGC